MMCWRTTFLLFGAVVITAGICVAQGRRNRGYGGWDGGGSGYDGSPFVHTEGGPGQSGALVNEDTVKTARETASHSTELFNWTNALGFEKDAFTFSRVIFKPKPGSRGWYWDRFGWVNDYPDSDLNLSFRLQQLTSLKVDPDGRVLKLTDPALRKYPFIYMVKAGCAELREEELKPLREYLLNGGMLMADDFWGDQEWESFENEMKRVLPNRSWTELPPSHPLFHCVYQLDKNKLQVPYIRQGEASLDPNSPSYGVTYQRQWGEDAREYHVRAWHDDKNRIIVLATHNTNNGDGWEREGEHKGYFETYSETRAYPLAINIVYYCMTH
jgi:hypothetical protein